jgi:hypothetical protein
MKNRTAAVITFAFFYPVLLICTEGAAAVPGRAPHAAQTASPATRRIGAIKAINGNAISLAPDNGPPVTVNVQPTTRLLRIAPGEKDLKNATPVAFSELQVGDRILVGGKLSEDGSVLDASSLVVMKLSDVSALQQQAREDWQKRGLGGLVSAIDPATGTVTISVTSFGGKKSIAVHTSKSTVFRRYAADSVKFEDARPSSLGEIHAGDQLRARGDRNADGTEFTAEEIVSGSFRNVAGTVSAVDTSAGTLTVQDVMSKKPVQVKVTADSQMHELPAEFAQHVAMRLKASKPAGTPGASAGPRLSEGQAGQGASTSSGGSIAGAAPGGAVRSGGSPDFQQILSHMPAVALSSLKKGAAVMMVTTEGSPSSSSTVITLLSGVEPILQAAPSGSQAMMLTPWSLGGAPGGDTGQ